MRCFLALSLDPAARRRLARILATLARFRGQVRWVDADRVHLTLQFLGEVDEALLPALVEDLAALPPRPPLRLRLAGAGRFPPRGRTRVLWVGLDGELGRLGALVDDIGACCAAHGFARDRRAFQPHLTLGRVKGPEGLEEIERELERLVAGLEPGLEPVHRFVLYESRIGPEGPRYVEQAGFALASED